MDIGGVRGELRGVLKTLTAVNKSIWKQISIKHKNSRLKEERTTIINNDVNSEHKSDRLQMIKKKHQSNKKEDKKMKRVLTEGNRVGRLCAKLKTRIKQQSIIRTHDMKGE